MWVFDGEQWLEEGGSEKDKPRNPELPRFDEATPELQVVELPRTQTRDKFVPIFPQP